MLFVRQKKLLPGRACKEYLDGLEMMAFPDDKIPYLGDVGRVLGRATNWQVARVPGLLHEADFFSRLARRVFPSTDYIRPRHELDYTPAPDLFHDIFGHTPMIAHPGFSDFYQKIGEASMKARGRDRRRLERIYWFTVEFGLIGTPDGVRIYGNGIISSYAETQYSLTTKVEKRPFNLEKMAEQDYDVWHMQELLFVIDSFEQLEEGFYEWARGLGLLG
jgi:phenylalanine-4-hydroxylase